MSGSILRIASVSIFTLGVAFPLAAVTTAAAQNSSISGPHNAACMDALMGIMQHKSQAELSGLIRGCNADASMCADTNTSAKSATGKDWFTCPKGSASDFGLGTENPSISQTDACAALTTPAVARASWDVRDRERIIKQCNGEGEICKVTRKLILDKEGSALPGLTCDSN
jgi:hypothetical protein